MASTEDHLKFAQEYVHGIFRGLLIINGGAVVALYTLLGTQGAITNRWLIWPAFSLFAAGLAFTIAAGVAGYSFHGHEMQGNSIKAAWWENMGIGCVVGSLVLFLLGSGVALASVLSASACLPA